MQFPKYHKKIAENVADTVGWGVGFSLADNDDVETTLDEESVDNDADDEDDSQQAQHDDSH